MPRFNRQRLSKIRFKPFEPEKEDSAKNDSTPPCRGEGIKSIKSVFPAPQDLNGPKRSTLPQKVLSSNFEEMRTVNSIPSKSTINVFSGNSPLKSRKAIDNRPSSFGTSFLGKNGSSSDIVGETFMQKEQAAWEFLSVSMGKGRMIRPKATQLPGQGASWHSKETKRLSYTKRLELFQVLSRSPSSFLDLHVRFGVSKQTIRRLVENGFLREVWGSKAIGVQFKLTNKSKKHLKESKAVARYDRRIVEKNPTRLEHRI